MEFMSSDVLNIRIKQQNNKQTSNPHLHLKNYKEKKCECGCLKRYMYTSIKKNMKKMLKIE